MAGPVILITCCPYISCTWLDTSDTAASRLFRYHGSPAGWLSITGRPAPHPPKHAPLLWCLRFGLLGQPISKEGRGHRELGSTMGWISRAWNQNTTNFLTQSPWQEFLPRKSPPFYLNNCSRRDPKRRPGIHSFQFHIYREWMCADHLFVLKCKHQEGIRT